MFSIEVAMRNYKWMKLDDVKRSIPAMDRQGVSKVARGVEQSSQTNEGWVQAYIATGGSENKMAQRLTGRNDRETWKDRRMQFLSRHLAKVRKENEPLWRNGEPSRRHLALIAWGYTPTLKRLKTWLKTQPNLSSGEWKRGVKILKSNPSKSDTLFTSKDHIKDINLSVDGMFRIYKRDELTKWRMLIYLEDMQLGGVYGQILNEIDNLKPECQTAILQLISLDEEPVIVVVESSMINQPSYRNKGIGLAVYQKAIELIQQFYQRPIVYLSNHCTEGTTSEQAMSVWSNLSKDKNHVSDVDFFTILYPLNRTNPYKAVIEGDLAMTIDGRDIPLRRNKMAPGYQSYGWTTQDWRSVFLHSNNKVSYDKKCGAKGTKLPSGKPRLCLPKYVIEQLLKTKNGTQILIQQARKKQRAKKGQRVAWHPKIKELHSKLESRTPQDDSRLRKNPYHNQPHEISQFFIDRDMPAVMFENVLMAKVDNDSLAHMQDYHNVLGIEIDILHDDLIHVHSNDWDHAFIELHNLFH